MTGRGRPKKIGRTLEMVLGDMLQVEKQTGRWELETDTIAYKKELFKEFWHFFSIDPDGVRKRLEEPPEYNRERIHQIRGIVDKPDYRPLPPEFVSFWARQIPDWKAEPVLRCQVDRWIMFLPALRGTPTGAAFKKWLKKIDKDLVPSKAMGAGHYGVDKKICSLFDDGVKVLRCLNDMYKQARKSTRSAKLNRLFEQILDEEEQERWRWWLWLGLDIDEATREEGISDNILRSRKTEAIALLDQVILRKGQQPASLVYSSVARVSGSSVQTVKNAVKRVRAGRRQEHREKYDVNK